MSRARAERENRPRGHVQQLVVVVVQERIDQEIPPLAARFEVAIRKLAKEMARVELEVQAFRDRQSREQRIGQRVAIDDVLRRSCVEPEKPDAALHRDFLRAVAEADAFAIPQMIGKRPERRVEQHVGNLVVMTALVLDPVLQSPRPCAVRIVGARLHGGQRSNDVVGDESGTQRRSHLAARGPFGRARWRRQAAASRKSARS